MQCNNSIFELGFADHKMQVRTEQCVEVILESRGVNSLEWCN